MPTTPLRTYDTCLGGCKYSCTFACTNGCKHTVTCHGCQNNCDGTCGGKCATGCHGLCINSCYQSCVKDCAEGCKTTCEGKCTGCRGGCGGCDTGCSSCTGSCSGGCLSSCSGKCQGTCKDQCGNQCKDSTTKNLSTFQINDLNKIEQEEITFIINAIEYEVTRRKETPKEISISIGESITPEKITFLIENLKKANSSTNITIATATNKRALKTEIDAILTDLKTAWNEVIDPEL